LVSKTGKDILYQLTRANERLKKGSLTLVGISNDLTFKERLDPRVISSLSEEETVFTNYTVDQLKEILRDRIKAAFLNNVVEDSALNLCAAMAGREHGDARRAIDLLRVAGEIAEREQSDKVKEEHIRIASQKMEEDKDLKEDAAAFKDAAKEISKNVKVDKENATQIIIDGQKLK